jgi:IS1 family transposase
LWVSFAPKSRLIIDFVLGPRKQYVADDLINATDKHLCKRSSGLGLGLGLKPLFVTDGLKFYAKALLKKYGNWVEFPKTAKRGRPKKTALLPDKALKYAQVVKIKNKQEGKLQSVQKRIIFGQNINQSEISTSLLERQNLTFRQDNNRISRKTIGFSKKIKSLYNQMRFYCTYFNFCRYHGGLLQKEEHENSRKKTPAQVSGITKKKWTLNELLNYRNTKNVN